MYHMLPIWLYLEFFMDDDTMRMCASVHYQDSWNSLVDLVLKATITTGNDSWYSK